VTGFGLHFRARALVYACVIASLGWPHVQAEPPATTLQAPPSVVGEDSLKLIKPPDTIEQLKLLRDEKLAELTRLQPATLPAGSIATTQPSAADAPRTAATSLYLSLQQLIERVGRHIALRVRLDELKRQETIDAFGKGLAQIQQRTKDIETALADPPPVVSEEEARKA
jgi:hypothetical protein